MDGGQDAGAGGARHQPRGADGGPRARVGLRALLPVLPANDGAGVARPRPVPARQVLHADAPGRAQHLLPLRQEGLVRGEHPRGRRPARARDSRERGAERPAPPPLRHLPRGGRARVGRPGRPGRQGRAPGEGLRVAPRHGAVPRAAGAHAPHPPRRDRRHGRAAEGALRACPRPHRGGVHARRPRGRRGAALPGGGPRGHAVGHLRARRLSVQHGAPASAALRRARQPRARDGHAARHGTAGGPRGPLRAPRPAARGGGGRRRRRQRRKRGERGERGERRE